MKIIFKNPLDFYLEVINTDEHVPSLHIEARVLIEQFQHNFEYKGKFWIKCSDWDQFASSLIDPLQNDSILQDISENLVLQIQKSKNKFSFFWKFLNKFSSLEYYIHLNVK